MINTETVLMQVQSQQIPPTWRVYRGKKTFFMREAAIYSFLFLLVMALVVYLYSDPFLAITYGPFLSNTADTQTFLMTRTIDFVVLGLFMLVFIGAVFWSLLQISKAQGQMLLLMPDGFVIVERKTATYPYATIRSIKILKSRTGARSLVLSIGNAGKSRRVRLDGRFGNSKQLAETIYTLWKQYTAGRLSYSGGQKS